MAFCLMGPQEMRPCGSRVRWQQQKQHVIHRLLWLPAVPEKEGKMRIYSGTEAMGFHMLRATACTAVAAAAATAAAGMEANHAATLGAAAQMRGAVTVSPACTVAGIQQYAALLTKLQRQQRQRQQLLSWGAPRTGQAFALVQMPHGGGISMMKQQPLRRP